MRVILVTLSLRHTFRDSHLQKWMKKQAQGTIWDGTLLERTKLGLLYLKHSQVVWYDNNCFSFHKYGCNFLVC